MGLAPPSAGSNREPDFQAIGRDIAALIQQVGISRIRLNDAREAAFKDQREVFLEILEVVDAFDRVFENIEPREAQADGQARIWVGNFRSVRKVLERILKKHGIVRIEAPHGQAVPGLHTIVETRKQLDLDDGTILEEFQRGYLWNQVVLRTAQVVTVKN